jgi:hypothetical protein
VRLCELGVLRENLFLRAFREKFGGLEVENLIMLNCIICNAPYLHTIVVCAIITGQEMRAETLMVLLNFTPEKIKRNHPFWKRILGMGIRLDQENIKFKEWEGKFNYLKTNWRFYKKIIMDFYSYLRLNFPNAIPYPLFFSYENCELGNTEYNEYQEDEFCNYLKKGYSENKQPDMFQFDESIHYTEYDHDENDDDYFYYAENGYDDDDDVDELTIEKHMVDLADKWLLDILSGESFYEKNKEYFSKGEIKHFLTCDWLEPNIKQVAQSTYKDLIEYYWKVKIRANGLNLPVDFFVNRFTEHINNPVVQNYIKFICKNKMYIRDEDEISDIFDYITNRNAVDFKNLTWQQLRRMSNEWHDQRQFGYSPAEIEEMKKKSWKKTTNMDFMHTIDKKTWSITEITTGELLYEEGEEMHNCVFSYLSRCISRQCSVFSVKNKINGENVFKRIATMEISGDFKLMQARGKYNNDISEEVKQIIIYWSNENKIKYKDYFYSNN